MAMSIQAEGFRTRLCRTICSIREALGFSQDEFADKLGRTVIFVRQLERGEIELNLETINRCADALGLHTHELLEMAAEGNNLFCILESDGPDNLDYV